MTKPKMLFSCRAKNSFGRQRDFYVRGRNFDQAYMAAEEYLRVVVPDKEPPFEILNLDEVGKIMN